NQSSINLQPLTSTTMESNLFFDGTQDIKCLLTRAQCLADIKGYNERQSTNMILMALADPILSWITSVHPNHVWTRPDLCQVLTDQYGTPQSLYSDQYLHHMMQGEGESVKSLFARMQLAFSKIQGITNGECLRAFVSALEP